MGVWSIPHTHAQLRSTCPILEVVRDREWCVFAETMCNRGQIFSFSHIAEPISCLPVTNLNRQRRGMLSHFINESDHWRARVEERRVLASQRRQDPLERARTKLKLAPGFLIRSAPKPRRVVDRVGT